MVKRIDHVGIAVAGIDSAIEMYTMVFGGRLLSRTTVESQGVEVAFVSVGEDQIELLYPITSESKLSKFIEKRGEGLHHLCVEVDDIEVELDRLANAGLDLVDKRPWLSPHGYAAFVHPKSLRGVSLELREFASGQ